MVRRLNDVAVVEAGDEVNTPDDVCRIEETECAIFVTRDKLDAVQPLRFPSRPMSSVDLEPMDPENVHVRHVFQAGVKNLYPEDPKDTGIQIWVGGVAAREGHHVWTTSHVDFVHLSPEIICRVIHTHRVPLFETVAVDVDLVTLVICEVGRFRVILLAKDAGEEVVQHLCDKVLCS